MGLRWRDSPYMAVLLRCQSIAELVQEGNTQSVALCSEVLGRLGLRRPFPLACVQARHRSLY